jgi:hypothetical protein
MNHRTLSFAGLLLLLALLIGCENTVEPDNATLRLNLASERFRTSRSLLPTPQDMTIATVRITGTGPKGQTVDVQSADQVVEIGNLAIGTWKLHAVGSNSKGTALVSGDLTTLLSSVTNEATLELTQLVGEGTMSIELSWDPDQVASDVRLEAQLFHQSGSPVDLEVGVLNKTDGTVALAKTLPAGSYYLKLQLFSQEVLVSGASQSLRILDGVTSDGSIELIIGDLSTAYTIMVVNNTMLPIEGSIVFSPLQAKAGDEVTLTYTPSNLPEGIGINDLQIDWYCEGILVQASQAAYTSIPLAGVHRYDVIVNHDRLGSLGSSTILLDMPR